MAWRDLLLEQLVDRVGQCELLGEALVERDLDLSDAALEGIEPLVHRRPG